MVNSTKLPSTEIPECHAKNGNNLRKYPVHMCLKRALVLYSMYGFIKQSSPKSRNKSEWIIYCIEIIKNRLLTNIEFCQLECKTGIHSITKWTVWSIMSFMLKTKIQYTVDTVTLCRSDSVMPIFPNTKHSIGRARPKRGWEKIHRKELQQDHGKKPVTTPKSTFS